MQAALRGVELVFVVLFTLAPLLLSSLTMSRCPAAAAHQRGGAPSIVSPSKVTLPACSTEAQHLSTRYSTTSWWPFLQERTRGVAPLVLAATSLCTSSRGRWSRNTFNLRSLPSRAALKITFLNSRPVAAILNSSPPPQTLKSPSLR